jgi:hypothetical protein
MISYDLRLPESSSDYADLITEIKRDPWCRPMASLWLIRTDQKPADTVARLWRQMDVNDRLLVVDISGDLMSWQGLAPEVTRWIHENNPAR